MLVRRRYPHAEARSRHGSNKSSWPDLPLASFAISCLLLPPGATFGKFVRHSLLLSSSDVVWLRIAATRSEDCVIGQRSSMRFPPQKHLSHENDDTVAKSYAKPINSMKMVLASLVGFMVPCSAECYRVTFMAFVDRISSEPVQRRLLLSECCDVRSFPDSCPCHLILGPERDCDCGSPAHTVSTRQNPHCCFPRSRLRIILRR